VENASNITMIKDVDPMLDNITVQGRCISLWHSHRLNEAHNPYSLDMVLQDSQNSRIQIFVKKEWMFRFEPFNRLLDGTRHYHEHEAVDVIGSVVAIGDVVPVQSAAGRKIRRTVVIEDSESNQLDCTFWDHWANMWDEYAQKRNELGHVVFILQLGKVKYWDGTPSIHNALFGTKMFINRDLPEIQAFRQRFKELPEYDENQFKISVFTPQKPVVTVAEFFHGAVKKMVSSIHECEQLSGYTAWELMERHGMDVDEYWLGELLDLVGKRFLFKIYYSDYNVINNNHTYRCDAVNDDPEFIKHFKDGFMQDEDSEDDFTTPANKIKVNNFTDNNLAGLCNGTRLQVLRLGINIIEAQIISGGSVGTICAIPRMVISPTDTKMSFKLNRRQFSIQVCFAMTINKSQGQTLLQVGLFLRRPVFSHGQLYVVVSRVKSKKGLKVLCSDKDGNYSNSTSNVVYKEVLVRI
ncbi:replication protein A 70 kDa DNA-binding subunit B, partial [Tanacetum coccineum]